MAISGVRIVTAVKSCMLKVSIFRFFLIYPLSRNYLIIILVVDYPLCVNYA